MVPERLERLEKLELWQRQGLDCDRDTVRWLLERARIAQEFEQQFSELPKVITQAMAAEREACAKLVEEIGSGAPELLPMCSTIATSIRARG